jgi:pimeloyl-ACP methyl ester carboxylesterase
MKHRIYAIPGTMCDERLWEKLGSIGSEDFEVIHTPIPAEESIEAISNAIIEDLPLDKFILLGFSFGGYISSCIATKIPNRIKHLFIISNSSCALKSQELRERNRNIELIKKYGYRGLGIAKASSMLDAESINDELVRTIIEMDSSMGVDTLIHQLGVGSGRTDLAVALSNSNVNMTFVFSDGDKLINKDWILSLSESNAQCDAISISGSGHMLPLEKPYEIVEILRCHERL